MSHLNVLRLLRLGAGVLACAMTAAGSVAAEADRPLKVALYSDPGCTDEKSREAVWKILTSTPGFQAERITSPTVASGQLAAYDVVVFPGGTANGEAKSLGPEGARALERYVLQGRGLIGICAGGYMIVEGWNPHTRALELVNAQSWDDAHWARGEAFIAVKLAGKDDADSSRTMWFENGPIFVPGTTAYLPPYVPLVRYETDMAAKDAPKGMMTGRDAVVAATFGKGRVVAFGPHPELSPGLNHWLVNAIRWASGKDGSNDAPPSVDLVLEGRR